MWNLTLDTFLKIVCGRTPFEADDCLYTRYEEDILEIIIMIYVDDINIMTRKTDTIMRANEELNKRFHMKDMGT